MIDEQKRKKVIDGLELCLKGLSEICPYKDSDAPGGCKDELMYDALVLLEAQEPVEPKIIDTSNSKLYRNDIFKNYYCGNCGEFLHVVNRRDMFYSQCGRAVKWNG